MHVFHGPSKSWISARKQILIAFVLVAILFLCYSTPRAYRDGLRTPYVSVSPSELGPVADEPEGTSIEDGLPHPPLAPLRSDDDIPSITVATDDQVNRQSDNFLPLPKDYDVSHSSEDWCEKAYGLSFLRAFSSNRYQYCDPATSKSRVECFTARFSSHHPETFCVASSVLFDPHSPSNPFTIDCNVRDPPSEGSEGGGEHPSFWDMPEHMMRTGLKVLLEDQFQVANETNPLQNPNDDAFSSCASPKSSDYTILIKRDAGQGGHPWHSMMEYYSYFLTMDILQLTPKESSTHQKPWFSPSDIPNTQIMFVEDNEKTDDGPFNDLWTFYASKVERLHELKKPAPSSPPSAPEKSQPSCLSNVILPLPGAANPLWLGDWEPRNCTSSPLLDVFSQRVLANYHISTTSRRPDTPLVVTFIHRSTSRRLRNEESYLDHLRTKFSTYNLTINAVDFGQHTFDEQLRIVRDTDVLVGVHGAGLSLQMFMPQRSSVVEILPFGFKHYGFRNLASLRGNRYFSVHADEDKHDEVGWQQKEEVGLSEERFEGVVRAAVGSVLQRGGLSLDVN